ncbi:SusC/RagA family TonB-linked outer membrane protein [Spirosoma fluviale]|uniref:TonB-linked outer membrane protein, SusC/RagA family n=1 Tax=Spirosoma fluviale TaxID=1597977 RepID=A0A286GUW1_9BACT|nr:TonB-dependent receptor [Spirosoma fluviale]SOD99280.1 TonB-linked outer membrane protein, SusC/RagA family [Spirosoma fluviale]
MKKQLYPGWLATALLIGWISSREGFSQSAMAYAGQTAKPSQTVQRLKNIPLRDALNTLKDQYKVDIVFGDRAVLPFSVASEELDFRQSIEKNLSKVLRSSGLTFRKMQNGSYMILGKGEKVSVTDTPLKPVESTSREQPAAQQSPKLTEAPTIKVAVKPITGTVTDEAGGVLPGVSILVKGTQRGTVSDPNGNYEIELPTGSETLVFSFVGYVTQEVAVGNRTALNVSLAASAVSLNDVVVVGYGVQKKKLVTGATVQITGNDLVKQSTVSPFTAMQSQSPGLSITKNSGKPGSDFKINIRGLGTIGNASPLVIIDNVVGGDLNMLNPGDIESIDVLKDAASAAIYGSRAANGVILVKTKQGKKGKPRLSYDGFVGVQNVAKYVDVLNAQQYIELENESYQNIGSPVPNWTNLVPDYSRVQQGWTGPNWQREFTNRNAPIQNHTLNLTGGSDYSTYSLGMSYTSQEGVYGQPKAPLYDRYSFRLNSEHVIYRNSSFDVVKLGENILYNFVDQKRNGIGTGDINWNDIRGVISMHPLMSVYDNTGNYTKAIPWAEAINPLGSYDYQRSNNESQSHNIRVNPYLEIQPLLGLTFRSNFGFKYSSGASRSYTPAYDLGGRSRQDLDKVDQGLSTGFGYVLENTINYRTSINNAHNINALIGQSIEKNGLGTSVSGSNRGSVFNSFEYAYLNNVKTLNPSNLAINGSPWGRSAIQSFFGRLNYDYKEKYMASIIMRADGSSNFAPDKRWGYFPSVAAGWTITDEDFMKSTRNVVDYVKLRASWGLNGNQAISPFQYLSTYSFSGANYYFGPEKNSVDVGAYPSILPNPNVTWEKSEQLNIGFDSRFFRSRFGIVMDWYTKTTRDWLVQAPVPAVWGGAAPFINGGNIENKGIELVLSWNDKVGDFRYSINANAALNRNKVTRIANTEGIIEGSSTIFSTADRSSFYRAQVGYPIGYFYGYQTAGVFQNQGEIDAYTGGKLPNTKPGDLIFVDTDNNKIIDSRDKTNIGDPNPDVIFGLNLAMDYKGFDFSLSGNGVAGNQIASNLRSAEKLYANWPSVYLGRWHGEGTSNRYPRLAAGSSPNWGWNSDIYVDNGDFFRIQSVALGYDFKKLMPGIPLTQARLYVAVNNLITFTNYYGADPEIGYANEGWSKGIDVGFYPSPRTVMVGLNLKF